MKAVRFTRALDPYKGPSIKALFQVGRKTYALTPALLAIAGE